MKVLSRQAALATLRLAIEVHSGKLKLPPEISAKKEEVKKAERQAYLFILYLGEVDHALVYRALQLRLELDGLYARWAESESQQLVSI